MKKTALITGITGQDGSYLAELLLSKGYQVIGLVRRASTPSTERIDFLVKQGLVSLIEADLSDESSLRRALEKAVPDEVYNLAGMSHVLSSFAMPQYTMEVNALGVLRLLEAILEIDPSIRLYQAATSELFGKVQQSPQNETTPFYPRSPYGIAKLCAYWSVVNFREAHGLFACNGILFNHESPRRGEEFVSRKISKGVSQISLGLQSRLILGNLEAKRDWGHAKDFVEGMWLMLQQKEPEDFVLATGKVHTVREFVLKAFEEIGIALVFEGKGLEEKGIDRKTGKVLVEVSQALFRPSEVDFLQGDSKKAFLKMGWKAQVSFEELISEMVQSDIKREVFAP
jgi:GDPmannose 4,6-dehydratase